MWKKVEYSKQQINEAGHRIADDGLSEEERIRYLSIIDNWRAAHAFPMNTFAIRMRNLVSDIDGAIVVQRLKRLDSITGKLERFPSMNLYRMQDLGGCRVIVPTVEDVYRVIGKIKKSRIRHILNNEKDYIAIPKEDTGYRGYHLIYKYKSDKRNDYNGMRIEIQVRTQLQHLWATAVETVGVFTQNGLKFSQGSEAWLKFFKLVSALFSYEENTAIVDGISGNYLEITSELLDLIVKLDAVPKLYTIGLAIEEIGHINKKVGSGYYLLILDAPNERLQVEQYPGLERGLDAATERYNRIEAEKRNNKLDAVLVSAQSYEALAYAYPNYFADISKFTETLLKIVNKVIDQVQKENAILNHIINGLEYSN